MTEIVLCCDGSWVMPADRVSRPIYRRIFSMGFGWSARWSYSMMQTYEAIE